MDEQSDWLKGSMEGWADAQASGMTKMFRAKMLEAWFQKFPVEVTDAEVAASNGNEREAVKAKTETTKTATFRSEKRYYKDQEEVQSLSKETGWVFTIMAGGLQPGRGGKLSSMIFNGTVEDSDLDFERHIGEEEYDNINEKWHAFCMRHIVESAPSGDNAYLSTDSDDDEGHEQSPNDTFSESSNGEESPTSARKSAKSSKATLIARANHDAHAKNASLKKRNVRLDEENDSDIPSTNRKKRKERSDGEKNNSDLPLAKPAISVKKRNERTYGRKKRLDEGNPGRPSVKEMTNGKKRKERSDGENNLDGPSVKEMTAKKGPGKAKTDSRTVVDDPDDDDLDDDEVEPSSSAAGDIQQEPLPPETVQVNEDGDNAAAIRSGLSSFALAQLTQT
ncbi:hypothetical protein AGABI1DRAFT_125371 [Agaricus bisporus var. burnettii JB137-S8]|uniref:Uncharacterized protein n=1 Tax=Agaricus bisporus var. burnettii (strain JB137-S8 / ATCC MYA-4627 / FGSC 10392) TaxID=597362 RepID=K5Y4E8_AGABU|nr:uncharacterized protein AGABI1DRAFT_125371 [Agaricus bisporus var. burnettii JB137-S8]EKM82905.1 hypothetical protein AGABI1DRAFT_125371 [Agaricus bisporus var. burnettii JB137-S8]